MSGGPYDVLLADKNPLILRAVKSLLGQDDRFETVVSTSDGERFLEALTKMRFDVGVVGWEMPFMSGERLLEALRSVPGAPPVLIYTGTTAPGVAAKVLRLGGAGLCSKSETPERVLDAIVQIAEGRMIFPFGAGRDHPANPLDVLTKREREILHALSSGCSNTELADQVCVSPNTVKFHLSNIYSKIGVASRAGAVRWYLDASA